MMKTVTIWCLLLLVNTCAFAENADYNVMNIPAVLIKNANAVKRVEEVRFEITSLTKTRLNKKYAITILNDDGDKFAYLYEYYDKLRSIKSIEGKLFDASGKEIRKLKNKDIEDRSAISEISLMEDSRAKVHSFYYKEYPYTVEYEVVIDFNNTLMIYPWFPQYDEKYAVEKSKMHIECPSWFTFRYKMFNYNGEPVINTEKDIKAYTWQINNLPAIIREYASPEFPLLTTCVFFSPDKFELNGYEGSMATWNEIGQFQLRLNKGRDKLPETIRKKVHDLTDNVSDKKEKIRILYEYLQKNTRYISIQLGIGGLQPFDATEVATKAYGDCKALSNYMYSLLKEVNINSCYTQIKAGRGKYFFIDDFPSDQFDHIILCVPLQKDTMWLECTSQTLPAGYLSDFTCNRYALAIDETGGKLVRTPKYGMKENLQTRNIKAKLDDNGALNVTAATCYTGMQQDDLHGLINHLSKEKVKEYLHEQLDFSTYDVNRFDYKEVKNSLPAINESLDITVSNYATITGKRLFIVPNVMTRSGRKLSQDSTRKFDIQLSYEYKDVDTVEIEIPGGFETEVMPQPVKVNSKFGNYSSSVQLKDNKLYYYRSLEHNSGRFPAKEWADLVKFYEAIYKADRSKVVLVRKEQEKKAF